MVGKLQYLNPQTSCKLFLLSLNFESNPNREAITTRCRTPITYNRHQLHHTHYEQQLPVRKMFRKFRQYIVLAIVTTITFCYILVPRR
jgi:hypothetical protein